MDLQAVSEGREDYLCYPAPDTDRFNIPFNEWLERYIVSAKYCYVTRKLRLHQNDRCKRFTLF